MRPNRSGPYHLIDSESFLWNPENMTGEGTGGFSASPHVEDGVAVEQGILRFASTGVDLTASNTYSIGIPLVNRYLHNNVCYQLAGQAWVRSSGAVAVNYFIGMCDNDTISLERQTDNHNRVSTPFFVPQASFEVEGDGSNIYGQYAVNQVVVDGVFRRIDTKSHPLFAGLVIRNRAGSNANLDINVALSVHRWTEDVRTLEPT